MANCISLEGSSLCPAFQSASVSTTGATAQFFPFMRFVNSRETFDTQLTTYIATDYVRNKYENIFGCSGINLADTDELYARFTTTVLCNAIVQNSISDCSLSDEDSRPVCADSCAHYAQSEALLTADNSLCANPRGNLISEIRADFTNCALPPDSLSSTGCIQAISNEPNNCGYGNSTIGLCSYCASGGINSTDTCCYNSNVDQRCENVTLPSGIPSMTFDLPTSSATSSPTASPTSSDDEGGGGGGLSGGAIAGIVIGSIIGALLILGLIFFFCYRRRQRPGSQDGSVFNQPSPSRKGPIAMEQQQPPPATAPGYEVLPGGRIARMSALEDNSNPAYGNNGHDSHGGAMAAAAMGAGAGYMAGGRSRDQSSSDFGSSPESESRAGMGVLRPPPTNIRRNGSLSSNSALQDPSSPISAGMSSPQGIASQQSEQLPFFKDYYSSDDIHPGDRVSVLWAYQPRAPDEFSLERGDMVKIVGIWDDGWATGIMVDERAEEWEARRVQRDSGVSSTSGRPRETSSPASGEIKAFPLVCVCLPEHWRKTIEGDGSTESGSGHQGPP
ncbi:SH3 domain-containing protein [Plectosphaerella plurivora]|uniref:SH3 domain-containing protein n=1 Tax=Plectosphaerella plurivora TaxID=936078 RepID=A0A9P8V4B8_9PEZI|nr:SH3 domain-containing protein [Plectosphaerella plurivora]